MFGGNLASTACDTPGYRGVFFTGLGKAIICELDEWKIILSIPVERYNTYFEHVFENLIVSIYLTTRLGVISRAKRKNEFS